MKSVTDTDTLITDLQTLLTDPHPTPTISLPPLTLSLPRHILSSRSPYFRTLLSDRWNGSSRTITKPNATSQQFQDILEFFTTGCITLSSSPSAIPHNLALAALAHEILAQELEHLVALHIAKSINRHTISDYLQALHAPLPPIDAVVTKFLCANTHLLVSIPSTHQAVTQVCRLLAVGDLEKHAYPHVAAYITASRIPLPHLISQPNVRPFLLRFPSPLFVRNFESSNLFSRAELLNKYRTDVLALPPQPLFTPPSVRLLHESTHPHPRFAKLERTIRHVVVPGAAGYAKIVFDKRSSLSGGAELAFYLEDPVLGTHPCKFLVGRRFETTFTLPWHEFWYAFASTGLGSLSDGVFEIRWGWKFFVESCSPDMDFAS